MSLSGHIDELRTRILRLIGVIIAGWILGWWLEPLVYEGLNHIIQSAVAAYHQTHPKFAYEEPFGSITDPFMTKFRLSFMLGLGMALPLIVLEIWGFVRPGLKSGEAKPIQQLAPVSVALFFLGAACCWVVLPLTFQWFLTYFDDFPGTSLFQQPGSMVFFTLKMLLAFGVGFQLPLVVYIAGRIGLVSSETLTHYWRHAAVFVFIVSAILTPSNDPITMLMMAIPLSALVMLSIWAVQFSQRRSGKQVKRAPELDDLD